MPDDPDDTGLESELRRVIGRLDGVPPPLLQAAVDSFSWRAIDAELAELAFDSLVSQDRDAAVRGPQPARLLSFEAGGLTIDVEISGTGSARTLIGQIVPPQRASVELRRGDDATSLEADELGRFSSGPLGPGPLSLRCTVGTDPDRRSVVTEWITM